MATYLITGSARGFGLALARALLDRHSSLIAHVFLTDTHTTAPAAVETLVAAHAPRASYLPLDITDAPSIAAAATSLAATLGAAGLDVLVNNAGVQTIEPAGPLAMPALAPTFAVNVQGTYNVTAALLPLLRAGSLKRILNVSSTLGSISCQARGLWTDVPLASYKISKAALNQMTVLFANALRGEGFVVFAVSPGWMRTEIAGGGPGADLEPAVSAAQVVRMLLEARKEDSGRYRNVEVEGIERYDGVDVAW